MGKSVSMIPDLQETHAVTPKWLNLGTIQLKFKIWFT